MRKLAIKLAMVLLVCTASSCGIFKSGCQCPKVSYNNYPRR